MKRFLFLLLILSACKGSLFGSHIVGGEFELLHINNFDYRLNMILYFDELNGTPGAKDGSVTVFFWRKSDNTLVRSLALVLNEDVFVPYSNTDCDDGQLVTSRIVYTNTITLSEEDFSDPEGYYVSWERCCRNYGITNIRSDVPNTGGISAGQTFYLEFPPVTRNGEPFVNSTPRLFPPLRDYGCVDKFYYVDFGGTDDDGDSLVYSLVTPYSTFSSEAIPPSPNPGPYPDVVWQSGFDIENIMGGDPDMAITTKGLLTVTPTATGLYVFAVKCEEYRDGEKIGEMRRDFQMLVVSNCVNEDPAVRAREVGNSGFYVEGDVLNFDYADPDKCVEILVTDRPVSGEVEENVTVTAIPINFDAELEGIDIDFSQNVAITSDQDTARFTVCFPDCPFTRNGFYQIGIVGLDDACPQPALDTVIVSINVPPPPNQNTYFADSKGASRISTITRTVTESAGGNLTLNLNAFDNDNDELSLVIEPLGFDLTQVGMSFTDPVFSAGQVLTQFNWNYDCNAADINLSGGRDVSSGGIIKKAFDILLTAEDMDQCEWEDPEELLVTMIIEFPNQTVPRVYRQGQPNASNLEITHTIGNTLIIPVRADDADNDNVLLQLAVTDFDLAAFNVVFSPMEGPGVSGVSSDFVLPVDCQFDLDERNELNLTFTVEDLDACQLTNTDSLFVRVNLVPPVNTAPQLTFASFNNLQLLNDTIKVIIGESIDAQLRGFDNDNDSLALQLVGVDPENNQFTFNDAKARGNIIEPFTWTPDCSIFTDANYQEYFRFSFLLDDKNCYDPKSDSLSFVVQINDKSADSEAFLPPNFFSPDGQDNLNEFFGPYRRAEANESNPGELVNILPNDNCAGVYLGVSIYNRWGNVVFESTSRDFKWFGKDEPAGVYYYQVKFSNQEFKGWVQMMK